MQKDVNGEAWFGVSRGDQGETRGGDIIFSTSSSLLDGLFKVYVTSEVGVLLGRQSSKIEHVLLDEEMLVHRL
jgi:hypothetical protein